MTGKRDARRKRSQGESYVENGGTRLAAKEISSVNGDNPYPGSNDDGMDAARSEEDQGRGHREGDEKERNGRGQEG